MEKDSRIQIRCNELTKRTFQAFAAGYDSHEAALVALLEAYGQQENQLETVSFDLSPLRTDVSKRDSHR